MCDIQTTIIILVFFAIVFLLVFPDIQYCICSSFDHVSNNKEGFFGGYYYPYDYPYYWPYFYTGCNEDVFGNIKCLPMYMHPFW